MWLRAEFPLSARHYPLGFAVDVESNHPGVLTASEESWGRFPKLIEAPAIRLRLGVEQAEGEPLPAAPVFRAQESLVTIVSDRRNFMVCDYRRAFAYGWVTSAVVNERAWLRWHFLEAAVYSVLCPLYLTAVHASCVARNRRGVLFCGASGAGKSMLAYACARRGWSLVSDDGVMLVRAAAGRRVIGKPHSMRFRETAGALLPELDGRLAARAANGKLTIEVPCTELGVNTAVECFVDAIVFLDRPGPPEAALTLVDRHAAFEQLVQDMPLYERQVTEEQMSSLERLLEAPAFLLRYSDLGGAVNRLESLVNHA